MTAWNIFGDVSFSVGILILAAGLVYFVSKRKDLEFRGIFLLFGILLFFSGVTRLLSQGTDFEMAQNWHRYIQWIEGLLSLVTAVTFLVILPKALALPSRNQLELANAALHDRTQKIVEQQKVLLELTKWETSDLADVLRTITQRVAAFLAVERVSIWFYNEGRSEIFCEALYQLGKNFHEKGLRLEAQNYPLYFKSLEESRTIAAADAWTDSRTCEFRRDYLEPLGITSMLDVPVRLRGQVIGIVCHEHVGPKRSWTPEEQEFAGAVADRVSLAIEADERRQAESELQKSLSLLQATLESTADGILVVDPEGKWASFNKKFVEMWRIPQWIVDSKDDKAALAFVLNQLKDPEGFIQKVQELYREPEKESYEVLEFSDGRVFERYAKPQHVGELSVGRVFSFRDVTERRLAEAALQESEAKYRRLVETSHDLIWSLDEKGRFTFLNRDACRRIYGYEPEEMLGRPFTDFETPEQAKKDMVTFEQVETRASPFQYESTLIRKDGAPVYLASNSITLRDSKGEFIGMTGTATDITAHKKAQEELKEQRDELKQANLELQKLSEMKSQFASMVSHELRSPLTVVKEGIGIVLDGIDGPVTPAQIDTLSIAKDNVDRLGRLINNVLDYEKLESGKLEMFFEKTDLTRLLQEAYQFMLRPAVKKGIEFQIAVPAEPVFANCDEDKIQEIVLNLLDNGIKYTAKGGRVSVSLGVFQKKVAIEVEDSGLGIKKEDQQKIFEMFGRGGEKGSWKIGGWGIGLAVCKMITELHKGEIGVESEVGRGTKFSVVFPANLNRT